MLFPILAVGAAVMATATGGDLANPPPDILGNRTSQAYVAFIEQQLAADRRRVARQPCAQLTRRWAGRDRTGGNNIPADVRSASATGDVVIEHVVVAGCGRTSRHNLMIYRQRSGGWMAVALPPGASLASPTLQRDTLSTAIRAVVQLSPNAPCPPNSEIAGRVVLGEIQVIRPPSGGRWTERLPIRYCGLDRTMTATFTLTSDGGADFALQPAWPGAPRVGGAR